MWNWWGPFWFWFSETAFYKTVRKITIKDVFNVFVFLTEHKKKNKNKKKF